MSDFVGAPVNKEVIKQIQLRENILGRKPGYENFHVRFKADSNAWIRVISGVDTQDTSNNFTSKLAKKHILSGGELLWDGNKFVKRESFNTTRDSNRGRYNFSDTFGIRPEIGITGFNIQHKNSFGTVREAIVTFSVWSPEDLEIAENLYFRPGMTVITEWGNTSYITNEENYVDIVTTDGINDFFNGGQKVSQSRILEILRNNINNSDYNYDAFSGFISNFSWSFREDGGFDCTINVLSRGSLLQSLSVIKGTDSTGNEPESRIEEKFYSKSKPPTSSEDTGLFRRVGNFIVNTFDDAAEYLQSLVTYADTELEEDQRLSLMHFFCNKVEEVDIEDLDVKFINFENFKSPIYEVVDGTSTGTALREQNNERDISRKSTILELNPVARLLEEQLKEQLEEGEYPRLIAAGFNGKTTGEGRTAFRYISMRTFLGLVNLSFLNGSDENVPRFNLRSTKQYQTFDNHFSFDPSVVLLPKFPTQPELKASKSILKQLSEIDGEDAFDDQLIKTELSLQNTGAVTGNANFDGSGDISISTTATSDPTLTLDGDASGTATFTNLGNATLTVGEPYTKVFLNNTSDIIAREGISSDNTRLSSPNLIHNIFISTKLIKENLDLLYNSKSTPENLDVLTFITNVLGDIGSALGGINEFDVHYDEINDELSVVDRSKILDDTIDKEQIPVLNVTGLSNTVKNLSMQTKIGSNLASMISISATSGTEGDTNNNLGLSEYNRGKEDRFKNNFKKPSPKDQEEENKTSEERREEEEKKKEAAVDKREKREKFFLNLLDAYTKFNNKKIFDLRNKGTFNQKKFDKLKGEKISRTKETLSKDLEANKKVPGGMLPIELSITLNGISGLVVGEVFRINKPSQTDGLLPKIYDRTGFVITGLSSTIENDKWFSTIKGLTFVLEPREEDKETTDSKSNELERGKY